MTPYFSNKYKVLKIEQNKLERELARFLARREKLTDQGKVVKDTIVERISGLKEQIILLEEEMSKVEQKCSKLQKLSDCGTQKLKTAPKAYMDAIKMTARNLFYVIFRKFRHHFNNFRNDHVILRELIRFYNKGQFWKGYSET